jgi:hypothetical protein
MGFSGFDYPVYLPGTCKEILGLRLVDLDDDGCSDVVAACKHNDRIGYYKQTCVGGQPTSSIGDNWVFLHTDGFEETNGDTEDVVDVDYGDFDGDGQKDIVAVMDKAGSVGVIIFLLNDIVGSSWSAKQVITPTQEGSASSWKSGITDSNRLVSTAVCDVDQDGDLDIFLLWERGDTLALLENIGRSGSR